MQPGPFDSWAFRLLGLSTPGPFESRRRDSFLRVMSEDQPPAAGRDPPARRRGGSGGVILAACAAAALAAGSVFATALILDEPDAHARILALFDQTPIRTIADANLP